jgi:hypothetical protein
MSGKTSSPDGNTARHIRAARDWLSRAEAQFADGRDVLAAATLMLANAELKLLVEDVASGAATDEPVTRVNPFRLSPLSRTLLGAASLAACLVIGVALGRLWAPAPSMLPTRTPATAVQIAETPEQPIATVFEVPGTTRIVISPVSIGEAQPEEPVMVADASTPQPAPAVHRPRPRVTHTPQPAEEISPPEPVGTERPVEAAEPEPSPAANAISPEEVALRTIEALSDRLLNGES